MKVLFKRGRRGGRLQPFVGHDEKEGRNAICAYSGRSRPPHPGLAEKEQKHNHALSGEAVYDIGLLPQRCCTFCAGYQSAVNMAVFNASQVETHFSTVFPSNKSALKSNAGALALRKTNSGFCRCRNTSQFKTYFLYRSMAFGEEGRGDTDAFSKPAHSQDSKSRCQAAFCAYPPLVTKQSAGRPLSRSGQSADWPARGRLLRNRPALTGAERRISLWAQGGTRFARAVCAPQTEGY